MPLSSLDIVFYYSALASGPSNNTLSLGSTISLSTITDALANNIYDDVTGDESAAGDIEYRGIYVKDTNTTYTMINTKFWIDGYLRSASGADTISIASTTFALGSNTMGVCSDESSAPNETAGSIIWVVENPSGPTLKSNTIGFTSESLATTISANFGATTLAAQSYFGIWLKRDVPVGASAYSNRSCTLKIQCETTASPYVETIIREFKVGWIGKNFYVVPIELD